MTDTNALVDRIMSDLDGLKPLVRDLLTHALEALKPPVVTDFVKIGEHTRASEGKAFYLYTLGSDHPQGPHIDKVELKADEIAAVLTQWNAEATATLKQLHHASDCALHNSPAYGASPCDCGAEPATLKGSQP